MANGIPWTCPYCNRAATITHVNFASETHVFANDNKDGLLGITWEAITCPNPKCREYELKASLHKVKRGPSLEFLGQPLMRWQMRPLSQAKPFPFYIPSAIITDYNEACLIRDLSPKASATLSRRCLQGIIHDFWGIRKARLIDEIKELKSQIDPFTWKAIDAVRSIGNIGAHMEKEIDLIIEVEPDEAQLLIGLIEILLNDWYVVRHEREEHLQGIVALAAEKKDLQNGQAV